MSYTIEVYRGNQKAERHFGIYALYVLFYPQLVAGPIERPQNLLGQFREKHQFEIQRVYEGLRLMLWGLFKKVVIADRLAIYVNQVYGDVGIWPGSNLSLATVFFAIQIYCDFSGYSDIAIGSAKVMGFKLMTNFNRPYFSKNIQEFWKRWHISLSTWFRDYLYVSIGGNRVSKLKIYRNVAIVFIISGFWHGANWTFVIWGLVHSILIIAYMLYKEHVRPANATHRYLICNNRDGAPLSLRGLRKIFDTLTDALPKEVLNILEARTQGSRSVSAHDLRHTCATVCMHEWSKENDSTEVLARMRRKFGWSADSTMPSRYAALAYDQRISIWINQRQNVRVEALRSLSELEGSFPR